MCLDFAFKKNQHMSQSQLIASCPYMFPFHGVYGSKVPSRVFLARLPLRKAGLRTKNHGWTRHVIKIVSQIIIWFPHVSSQHIFSSYGPSGVQPALVTPPKVCQKSEIQYAHALVARDGSGFICEACSSIAPDMKTLSAIPCTPSKVFKSKGVETFFWKNFGNSGFLS